MPIDVGCVESRSYPSRRCLLGACKYLSGGVCCRRGALQPVVHKLTNRKQLFIIIIIVIIIFMFLSIFQALLNDIIIKETYEKSYDNHSKIAEILEIICLIIIVLINSIKLIRFGGKVIGRCSRPKYGKRGWLKRLHRRQPPRNLRALTQLFFFSKFFFITFKKNW